jgi:hypothetical protein
MTRALLLLSLAAASAGCYGHPCYGPTLTVYWTPGQPQAGFVVDGLTPQNGFPNPQLGCVAAGVDAVDVTIGGAIQPCNLPGYCGSGPNSARWRCSIDGLSVPLDTSGTYDVIVDGYDAAGNAKFSNSEVAGALSNQGDAVPVASCGDTVLGAFPRGLDGSIGLDWNPLACITPSAAMQFQVDPIATNQRPFPSVKVGPGSTTYLCTGTSTIPVASTAPAGVYSVLMDEWDPGGGTNLSTYDPVGGVCRPQIFMHAGPDVFLTTLTSLPTPGTVCVQ